MGAGACLEVFGGGVVTMGFDGCSEDFIVKYSFDFINGYSEGVIDKFSSSFPSSIALSFTPSFPRVCSGMFCLRRPLPFGKDAMVLLLPQVVESIPVPLGGRTRKYTLSG